MKVNEYHSHVLPLGWDVEAVNLFRVNKQWLHSAAAKVAYAKGNSNARHPRCVQWWLAGQRRGRHVGLIVAHFSMSSYSQAGHGLRIAKVALVNMEDSDPRMAQMDHGWNAGWGGAQHGREQA